MDFSKLEQNIIDVIQEEQIKLGYRKETIHLYYPLLSLNRLLEQKLGLEQMQSALADFGQYAEKKLGKIEVSNKADRFCFTIPPKGVTYVHEHTSNTEFLADFIRTIEKHGCTMEDILKIFYQYSDKVHVEKTKHGEFDYLVYFEDGVPDQYRYCLTDEGCHMIYHRFTPEDYKDFQFK